MKKKLIVAALIPFLLTLTACGGGGDSTDNKTPVPIISEGLWTGSTYTNRDVVGLVLDDGTYYFLYSAVGNSSLIAGVVQGTSSMSGGVLTSSDTKDFNLEVSGVLDSTISATIATKQSLDGVVTYSDNSKLTFTTTYDSNYELSASLSNLSGAFSGSVASSAGKESANITIAQNGSITGLGASGCQLTGQANPREKGNVYNLSINFGGSPCLFANETLMGIAYYDIQDSVLYVAAPNDERNDGILFRGNRE